MLQDVLWSNVGLSSSSYLGAAVLAWTLFALLAIFYLVPVGAVQALLQVDKLERYSFFSTIMRVSASTPAIAFWTWLCYLDAMLRSLWLYAGMDMQVLLGRSLPELDFACLW